MVKTVTLRMNQENGQWLYSLPLAEGKITKLGNGDTIESRKRALRNDDGSYAIDPKVKAEQDKYNYHYALLDEKYTGLDREDLNQANYPNRASLNVKTGEVIL